MGVFLEGGSAGVKLETAARRHAPRDDRQQGRGRAVRLVAQEQGRPAAARRDPRLSAVAARPPPGGRGPQARQEGGRAPPVADQPLLALAFKVLHDPHRGPLVFFRVYSGVLRVKDGIQNCTQDRKERVTKLLQVHANKTQEIDEVTVGNIAAAVGLRFTTTGDTVISAKDGEQVILPGLEIPEPVIFRAIEAKLHRRPEHPHRGPRAHAARRPQLPRPRRPDSGQTLMGGMGELHLEIIVDRIHRERRSPPMSASPRSPTARPSAAPHPPRRVRPRDRRQAAVRPPGPGAGPPRARRRQYFHQYPAGAGRPPRQGHPGPAGQAPPRHDRRGP
jgi:hypothetical protein